MRGGGEPNSAVIAGVSTHRMGQDDDGLARCRASLLSKWGGEPR